MKHLSLEVIPMRKILTYYTWTILILCPILINAQSEAKEQIEIDSSSSQVYYNNLNNQFILRFFLAHKANGVEISKGGKSLRYRPNGTMSLGVGFNYKFLGLAISVGLPTTQDQTYKYGKTQRLDLQVSIYSKAIGADAHIQSYKGYYLANPSDFNQWNEDYYPQLTDMQVSTIGANLFYIFNNDKFSYKAPFIGNQVQKKSAGSAVTGLFFILDEVKTDSGFIPKEIVDTTWNSYDIKSFKATTFGITAGYLYTFVIGKKGFFISLAGVPGIGYRKYAVVDINNNEGSEQLLALHLMSRIALGYTRSNLFVNLTSAFNLRNYEYNSYNMGISTEQIRLTFGLRFETKASKKRKQFYE